MKHYGKLTSVCLLSVAALMTSTVAPAQSSSTRSGADSQTRESWIPFTTNGYVGASIGRTYHDLNGCASGASCDDTSVGFKAFIGGHIMPGLGVELGYVNLGNLDRNNSQAKAHGANLGLVGFLPIGESFDVMGKVGGMYSWTRTSSNIPGVQTGKESGIGLSYGLGGQWKFADNWALRADWDRYRVKYAGEHENADMLSMGVVFRF